MAVDITLVLGSEHRRLRRLIDRCGRPRRGLSDPVADLRAALLAHVVAAGTEVYPMVPTDEGLGRLLDIASRQSPSGEDLVEAAELVIAVEQAEVVPVLAAVEAGRRRRMGRAFRVRRDESLRRAGAPRRRQRSQTELYQLARRAGVQDRSHMTQAQLQHALQVRGITD